MHKYSKIIRSAISSIVAVTCSLFVLKVCEKSPSSFFKRVRARGRKKRKGSHFNGGKCRGMIVISTPDRPQTRRQLRSALFSITKNCWLVSLKYIFQISRKSLKISFEISKYGLYIHLSKPIKASFPQRLIEAEAPGYHINFFGS